MIVTLCYGQNHNGYSCTNVVIMLIVVIHIITLAIRALLRLITAICTRHYTVCTSYHGTKLTVPPGLRQSNDDIHVNLIKIPV